MVSPKDRHLFRDFKKEQDRKFLWRKREQYPPFKALTEAELRYWDILFPMVVSNELFEESWLIVLRMLCSCWDEESLYSRKVRELGLGCKEADWLWDLRVRMAQYCNIIGLGNLVVSPQYFRVDEMKIAEMKQYDASVLMLTGETPETLKKAKKKKVSKWK